MTANRWPALAGVLLCSAASVPAFAQPQMALSVDPRTTEVSSADRLDETLEQIGNSATVITKEEIELRGRPVVLELLKTVPGVDVVQAGGPGGTASVFIRGEDSSHTLVLLDGLPLNDASSPARTYDFANLTSDNVERIEILRGPQSAMYGSDAIGGVINIVTKKGSGPLHGSAGGEWGSYNTNIYRGELSGSAKYADFSVAGSRAATGGIPAAGSDYGNTIRAPYRNGTFSGSIGLKPTDDFRLDLNARNACSFGSLADAGGAGGADPSYTGSSNETDLLARGTLASLHGKLVQTFVAGAATQNRLIIDDFSSVNPTSASNDSSWGQTTKFSYQAVARLADWNTLTAGVESQEERAHTDYASVSQYGPYSAVFPNQDAYTKSLFAEELLKYGNRLVISIGGRRDDGFYGGADTYRAASALLISETSTKLKASVGTGFKAPSLYELFSQYGASSLLPERSAAWDAGFEQDFLDRRVTVGATYFRSRTRDLIQFDGATNLYYNVGRAQSEGYEFTEQARLPKQVLVKSEFTYTAAEDLDNNTALLRRPRIKFGGDVETHPAAKATFLIGATYTGPAQDQNFTSFPAAPVTLGGYALWHAAGSYAVTKNIILTARIDNMFNKRYEQVEGYGTLGIGGYGGVTLEF